MPRPLLGIDHTTHDMTAPQTALFIRLTDRIDELLPQTQCRRCGYDDCRGYAEALARGEAEINRCPPGRDDTIAALSRLLDRPVQPLADDLSPMPVRQTVRIDPGHCIGCTKCILACPVDAIVGAPRFMHQVLADRCTGCELCLPPCPTDCIEVLTLPVLWHETDARHGRQHHQRRDRRLAAEQVRERSRGHGRHAAPAGQASHPSWQPTEATTSARSPEAGTNAPSIPASTAPEDTSAPGTVSATTHASPADLLQARDPRTVLAAPDEKARRLAAIREKLAAARAR